MMNVLCDAGVGVICVYLGLLIRLLEISSVDESYGIDCHWSEKRITNY